MSINKEYFYELQKIDCNCNDCGYMQRDLSRPPKKDTPSPINYGHCTKFDKPVSFIPAVCQLETQGCFVHRKDMQYLEKITETVEQDGDVDIPKLIGSLNKVFGINGYKKAEIGHPVYETKDRYIIYLTHERGFETPIPFYKKTLHSSILFIQNHLQ